MKLGSLKSSGRDGELIVVSKDNERAVKASHIAPSLREAIENWGAVEPKLRALAAELDAEKVKSFPVDYKNLHAPLPRAFQWADGSAYIHHIKLVRMARNA